MTYHYLAGIRFGGRMAREKKFLNASVRRAVRNFHAADKGGRMYWCDCCPSYRLPGIDKPRWFSGGMNRHKTFNHHRGSKYHAVRWQYKPTPKDWNEGT